MAPGIDVGIDRAEPAAGLGFGRDGGVVDQRVQRAVFQPLADFRNPPRGVGMIGKIDLDVILGPGSPWALLGKGMPRTGDDAPARAGKTDHRRMTDATAGAGQKQRAPRSVVGRVRHGVLLSRV